MTKRGRFFLWFVPVAVLYVLGFVAAALWDMPIDVALYPYGVNSLYAALMEAFGWYPAFLPTVVLIMVWLSRRGLPKSKLWQPVVTGLVLVVGCGVLYRTSWGYMVDRGLLRETGDVLTWVWLCAGVVLAAAALVLVFRAGPALREKLAFFGWWGSLYMVANQVVVYPIKTLWARTRFDTMVQAGSFDAFTPWWQPLGHGGSSFPSGHTANAAGIFILLVLCDLLPAWNRRRRLVLGLCWAYVAAMAVARIMIGRHFLSDTLAASAIMALLIFGLRRTKAYQKGLRRVKANAAALQGGPHAL